MTPAIIEDLIRFSQNHPCRPFWPEAITRRFLTKLISSDDLVLETVSNGERVGAGVLIDQIQNPANQACLEFIGLKRDVPALDVIGEMIRLAAERLPSNRAGFQVTLHDSFAARLASAGPTGILNNFSSAFTPGDQATFEVANIPVIDESGKILRYERESVNKEVSVKAGVAEVKTVIKHCYDREVTIVDYENGQQTGQRTVIEPVCDTSTTSDTFTQKDYEQKIAQLFDADLTAQALLGAQRSGEVTIELVEHSEVKLKDNTPATLIRLSFKGTLDSKPIDGDATAVFSNKLPFVANPVLTLFKTKDEEQQTSTLKKLNNKDIEI